MAHSTVCCKAMAVTYSSSSSSTAANRRTPLNLGSGRCAPLQGVTLAQNSFKGYGMAVASGGSLLLPSLRGTPLPNGDEHKACWSIERRSGAGVVRASSIGVVKEVKLVSKEPIYYNVTLTVPEASEVAKWYKTPGQYVNLLPVKSKYGSSSAFFIASPVRESSVKSESCVELEFLIEDVPGSVANKIVNSEPNDCVCITTNTRSTGFDLTLINSVEDSQYIHMFASGYGLGPLRAFIEGFEANTRKHVILHSMFTPEQQPYKDRFSAWEARGVKIELGCPNKIEVTNPASTVVMLVASQDQQEKLANCFVKQGVSEDRILTLFDGIRTSDKASYSRVLHKLAHYPKFLHHGEKHVPVEVTV